jgi:hypothetical protein
VFSLAAAVAAQVGLEGTVAVAAPVIRVRLARIVVAVAAPAPALRQLAGLAALEVRQAALGGQTLTVVVQEPPVLTDQVRASLQLPAPGCGHPHTFQMPRLPA